MRRSSAHAAGSRSAVARATPPSAPTPTGDRSLDRARDITARRSHAAARARHDPLAGLPAVPRRRRDHARDPRRARTRPRLPRAQRHPPGRADPLPRDGARSGAARRVRARPPRGGRRRREGGRRRPRLRARRRAPRAKTRWRTERSARATPSSCDSAGTSTAPTAIGTSAPTTSSPSPGWRPTPPSCSSRAASQASASTRSASTPAAAATFPAHRITLPAGLWHLEGLIGLERLPARGSWIIVGVIPVVGGSGAPARVLAILPA